MACTRPFRETFCIKPRNGFKARSTLKARQASASWPGIFRQPPAGAVCPGQGRLSGIFLQRRTAMGWLFTDLSRTALINDLLQPRESEYARRETLDSADRDNVLWSVVRITALQDGVAHLKAGQYLDFIRCDLLDRDQYGWGCKTLDESMGPCYYSCPLEFLDMTPVQCQSWRDQVRRHHALVRRAEREAEKARALAAFVDKLVDRAD